jgi:hypothetical protein
MAGFGTIRKFAEDRISLKTPAYPEFHLPNRQSRPALPPGCLGIRCSDWLGFSKSEPGAMSEPNVRGCMSFPRRRESSDGIWIPACAGMTVPATERLKVHLATSQVNSKPPFRENFPNLQRRFSEQTAAICHVALRLSMNGYHPRLCVFRAGNI